MTSPVNAPLRRFERAKTLGLLFFTFFKIAALVVGGGLAMLPVIEETFVRKKKLLTSAELLDVVTLTQTVPGIVAVNSAVGIGWKVAGFAGAVCAATGAVLPSFAVIILIACFFPHLQAENPLLQGAFAGIRAAVAGLIAVTAFRLVRPSLTVPTDLALVLGALALLICGVSPVWIILAAIPLGWALRALELHKEKVAQK